MRMMQDFYYEPNQNITQQVSIAQSVERKTEDLEAACSIHARDIVPFAPWHVVLF